MTLFLHFLFYHQLFFFPELAASSSSHFQGVDFKTSHTTDVLSSRGGTEKKEGERVYACVCVSVSE